MTDTKRGGLVIPMLRAGVRYAPHRAVRAKLWHRYVEPEIAWRDHAFVANTAAGQLAGNTRDILQQYLYYFGVWEPEVTAFLNRRLSPGDGFLDVGANIGYFSLLAAKRVGLGGRIVAVEASPTVYERLVANVRLNGVLQVRTLNVAAAEAPGLVKLYCWQEANCGATSVVPEVGEPAVAVVEAAPLSALVGPEEWSRMRLVKIDVEGAEAGVVRGLGSRIAEGRADREYLIELHPAQLERLGHTVEDVLAPFRGEGYNAYTVGNDYDVAGYLNRATPARPRRLDKIVDCDTNVILSRIDAREL